MNASLFPSHEQRSGLFPLMLALAAFVAFLTFQTIQLMQERSALATLTANQDKPIAESQKLRQQLDHIAGQTAALANHGNANAKAIVAEMEKLGVTIGSKK